MPFVYRNIMRPPHEGDSSLPAAVAALLGIPVAALHEFRIVRKGVDARRKPRIKLVYTVSFTVPVGMRRILEGTGDPNLEWQEEAPADVFVPVCSDRRIVIAGTGPAGLFAALRLADHGLTATIVERGQPVERRARDVQRFWQEGVLDPGSNVQFGEGGAGTFSDGKLTCRSKDPLIPWILERLTDFGAPPEIRYLAKPHIGTDRLRGVVAAIRRHLIDEGFGIRFGCRLSGLRLAAGRMSSVLLDDTDELPCDLLILATGHSARDTYEMLERTGVPLEPKPFAMGLRIEHPQELVDRIQYGCPRQAGLPAADYAITWNDSASSRSAYSFCMCPGGVVIGGSSEEGGVVTNGMSAHLRDTPFANSALVVNVGTGDFIGSGPLGGVLLQRQWEQAAFRAGGGGYRAPAQSVLSFLKLPGGRRPASTYRPGITPAELDTVLPGYIVETLRQGLRDFGRRLKGFVSSEAMLVGIESRTSAPVRILRDDNYESTGVAGLYPAGEGAGYAGGIMSSAVDGVRIADRIVQRLK